MDKLQQENLGKFTLCGTNYALDYFVDELHTVLHTTKGTLFGSGQE